MENVHFSSKSIELETPQIFFESFREKYDLNIDVCASVENKKLPKFWDKEIDGLSKNWKGKRCWMNPPYGKEISKWVEKAATGGASVVVALLPARTDTQWFHKFIYKKSNVEIIFIEGRLKFNNLKHNAPFPNMVVIFKKCTG